MSFLPVWDLHSAPCAWSETRGSPGGWGSLASSTGRGSESTLPSYKRRRGSRSSPSCHCRGCSPTDWTAAEHPGRKEEAGGGRQGERARPRGSSPSAHPRRRGSDMKH